MRQEKPKDWLRQVRDTFVMKGYFQPSLEHLFGHNCLAEVLRTVARPRITICVCVCVCVSVCLSCPEQNSASTDPIFMPL